MTGSHRGYAAAVGAHPNIELKLYNPELLDKERILAISKSDMLDEELMKEIKRHLPRKIPHIFISSVTGYNITELKDLIWKELNKEYD